MADICEGFIAFGNWTPVKFPACPGLPQGEEMLGLPAAFQRFAHLRWTTGDGQVKLFAAHINGGSYGI